MRFNGTEIKDHISIVVIPKGSNNVIFKAKPVRDYSKFEAMCPMPSPPMSREPGKDPVPDFSADSYIQALDARVKQRTAWMILESLSISEGLEWSTVDMLKPETWNNVYSELDESFSIMEQNYIHRAIAEANGLDGHKIEEATESFLRGLAKQDKN